MNEHPNLAIIAAVGPNLELGRNGDLVWHISADLKRFKQLTLGHPVIMGRKTWESLPKRPLPGRINVVLSRSLGSLEGATVVSSLEEAVLACQSDLLPFVIGGEKVYSDFLPLASVLYITHVDDDSQKNVDAWFPEYRNDWSLIEASDWATDDKGIRYRFETWKRR